MNRIIKKILIITICFVVLVFAAFAVAETMIFSKILKKNMDDKLFYETKQFANQMSMVFENAEGSVDTLCAQIGNGFDIEQQRRDSSYIKRFLENYAPVIKEALMDIENSQGLYMTFSPDIAGTEDSYELWYCYDKNGDLIEADATVNGIYFEAFEDEEFPTMEYYFSAISSPGGGVWTEPYEDTDINEEVIAYSRAVYSGDTLIGVVGTDIYTKHTINFISDMKVENNGMVFLLDQNNKQIISSKNVDKTGILNSNDFWRQLTIKMKGANDGLLNLDWQGETMHISFSELSNDWKLAVFNYEDKMYRDYRVLLLTVGILSAILVVLLVMAIYFTIRYFSSPMDKAIKMLNMMDLDSRIEEDDIEVKDKDDIEAIVKKAVKRQRMNDIMMANQSRLASVGEMMANVTHQWKQPLNNINIVIGNLKDDIESGNVTEENALSAVKKVENLTTGMSETLNDFMDYLKPDTKLVEFNVYKVVCAATELLRDKINERNINLEIEGNESLISYGYKNALYHVIINIINNAMDAIDEKGSDDGKIRIRIGRDKKHDGRIYIVIYNNGVQLSENDRRNLFKPYYTTKEKADGTGLGLAISKHFIEESMDGEITLENYDGGVRCKIIIDGKEKEDDR